MRLFFLICFLWVVYFVVIEIHFPFQFWYANLPLHFLFISRIYGWMVFPLNRFFPVASFSLRVFHPCYHDDLQLFRKMDILYYEILLPSLELLQYINTLVEGTEWWFTAWVNWAFSRFVLSCPVLSCPVLKHQRAHIKRDRSVIKVALDRLWRKRWWPFFLPIECHYHYLLE